eukprot:TRINITY_DN8442_c0_g1_i1.p1 TRINITY_DN8442_c0_g1~~TRINITY_DN8442_c0_g1_i1.p1  ORF type:complete len:499 (+),score=57.16 TRINITY_DN8442_c0_g1_i1:2-1498(+)
MGIRKMNVYKKHTWFTISVLFLAIPLVISNPRQGGSQKNPHTRPKLTIQPEDLFDTFLTYSEYTAGNNLSSQIMKEDSWGVIWLPIKQNPEQRFLNIPFIVDTGIDQAHLCHNTWNKLHLGQKRNQEVELPNGQYFEVYRSVNQFEKINVIGSRTMGHLKAKLIIHYPKRRLEVSMIGLETPGFSSILEAEEDLNNIQENTKIALKERADKKIEFLNKSKGFIPQLEEMEQFKKTYFDLSQEIFNLAESSSKFTFDNLLSDAPASVQFAGFKINHTLYEPNENLYYTVTCKGYEHYFSARRSKDFLEIGNTFLKERGRVRIALPVRSLKSGYLWVPFLLDTASPNTYISEITGELLGFNEFRPAKLDIAGTEIHFNPSPAARIDIRLNNILGTNFLNHTILVIDYNDQSIAVLPKNNAFACNWPPRTISGKGDICLKVSEYITLLQRKLQLELAIQNLNSKTLERQKWLYKAKIGEKMAELQELKNKAKEKLDLQNMQ